MEKKVVEKGHPLSINDFGEPLAEGDAEIRLFTANVLDGDGEVVIGSWEGFESVDSVGGLCPELHVDFSGEKSVLDFPDSIGALGFPIDSPRVFSLRIEVVCPIAGESRHAKTERYIDLPPTLGATAQCAYPIFSRDV